MTDQPESDGSPSAARDPYLAGLLLLLGSLVTFALAEDRVVARVLALVFQGATLLVILWASRVRRRVLVGAATIVGGSITLAVYAAVTGHFDELGTPFALTALLALAAPAAITRRLATHARIDASTVYGALCLYVLAGLFFASLYAAVEAFTDGSFFAQIIEARAIDFVYFSFVTLATLGYGDLTPAGDLGRMLAITQTMLGQLYLVGVVAVLVSNLGQVRSTRKSPEAR